MKNPNAVAAGNAGNLAREENKKSHKNDFLPQDDINQDELDKDEEQAPVKSWTLSEYEEDHPTIAESPFEIIGDINRKLSNDLVDFIIDF